VTATGIGFIVVMRGHGGRWMVPEQDVAVDLGDAEAARDRGNRRAGLAARAPAYELAAVTVPAQTLELSQIRAWLTGRGWQETSEGPAGTRWNSPGGSLVDVPAGGGGALMAAIDRIAAIAGLTTAAMLAEMTTAGIAGQ
jgi:hypothetical protein